MTTPYSADDLIKRSILGSIIGFGLKKAKGDELNSAISDQYPCQQSSSSSNARNNDNVNVAIKESNETDVSQEIEKSTKCVKHIHDADNNFLHYRSQQDIYHEIVCECAQLENNFSNCSSSRSSTQSPPLSASAAAAAALLNDSTQTTTQINSVINRNVFLCEIEQQSTISNTPTTLSIGSSETNSDSTSDNNNNNNISIEDFVKLVVTAVKKAGFFPNQKNNDLTETPEEILRRKRAQNNEAAARYRKRRRELKVEAKEELKVLIVKNKQLKQQVECLQAEITRLKTAVLTTSSSSSSLNPNSQFSSQITEPSQ